MMRGWIVIVLALAIIGCTSTPVVSPEPSAGAQTTAPSVRPPRASPAIQGSTSYDLIAEAHANGEIDEEHAVLYGVLAAFGDPRLPGQFVGAQVADLEPPVDLTRIATVVERFSAEVRAQVEPYLIPPMHAGSWWDLRHNDAAVRGSLAGAPIVAQASPLLPILDDQWGSVLTQNGRVRLWYPAHSFELSQLANATRDEIDSVIWPRLVTLMGIEPLPDLGGTSSGHGSDDALDLVIQDETGWAMTAGRSPNFCERTPAWILLDPVAVADLEVPWNSAVAHELMHAFQFALDLGALEGGPNGCDNLEYVWWAEATATWVEDHVYPAANSEWSGRRAERHVEDYMTTLGTSIANSGRFTFRYVTARNYGAYLFPFYLARRFGEGAVAQAWREMANAESELAVDRALAAIAPEAGGLEKVWSEFAVTLLNEAPHDYFRQQDRVPQRPIEFAQENTNNTFSQVDTPIMLGSDYEALGAHDGSLRVEWERGSGTGLSGLHALSSTYVHYKFTDPNVRSFGWINGMTHERLAVTGDTGTFWSATPRPADEIDGLHVQALYRMGDGDDWILEDWTNYPWRTFCRDVADERLTELVIIVSNSRSDGTFLEGPEYTEGIDTAKDSRIWVSDMGCYRWQGSVRLQHDNGNFHVGVQVEDLILERMPDNSPFGVVGAIGYMPIQGLMRWTLSNTDENCTEEGEGTSPIEQVQAVSTFNHFISGSWYRGAGGALNGSEGKDVPITCDGEPQEPYHFVPNIPLPADGGPSVLEDGGRWSGSSTSTDGNVVVTWDLEAIAE